MHPLAATFLGSPSATMAIQPAYLITPLILLPILLRIAALIRKDYYFFLSLGPGGTPSTPSGYLRICLLRLIARKDVLVPPPALHNSSPFNPFFQSPNALPARKGTRPKVAGIAPQRQVTQKGGMANVEKLSAAMKLLAEKNPGTLSTGKSCFEKHSLALFLNKNGFAVAGETGEVCNRALTASDVVSEASIAKGIRNATCGTPPEIAHLHGSECSLHLTLHPADAAVVIERGWGERHPLAGRGNWVPKGFVLIYAPRNEAEVETVMEIVRAGGWWVGGIELES